VGTAPPSNTFFPAPSTTGYTQRSRRSKSFSRSRVCTRFRPGLTARVRPEARPETRG
jgi:hypothetical protein